jgi:hypothetical protein
MARARTLKPGFFKNEVLGKLPPLCRILFAGLWTQADRDGRLEDRPLRLKAELLPYDDCDVDAFLQYLHEHHFIRRYLHGGVRYIAILTFGEHQNPHVKEPASKIPAPDEHSANPVQAPDEHQKSTVPAGPISHTPIPYIPISHTQGARVGELCKAMREKGVSASPHEPEVIALAEAGATPALVASACERAREKKGDGKRIPPGYVYAIVRGWLEQPATAPPRSSADVAAEAMRLLEERDAQSRPAETH